MSTKFMSGTELFMYECMMQQTPNMARCEREEKRFKSQYIGLLRDYMREYGYGEISKRVMRTLDRFLFDEFVFCNEEHRDMFWRMYSKWIKNGDRKDFSITSYEISMVRAACLLGDFSQKGTFLRKYYKKPIITNEKQLAIVSQFEQVCINNGNREDTASAKGRNVCQMLKYFSDNGIDEICDISPEIIERYILTFSRYAKNGIHSRVGHLKAFFVFLYQTNHLKTDYSKIFPTYNAPRNAKIPCVWKHDDVVKMLEVVDRGNPSGKRDYAILMLVTHLGLRIGDVKLLKFDNFKWNTNRLELIQSKTGEFLSLPLSREVGWAVIDYIQNGRPLVDTDVIFVRHCAPYCGFCKGNSLGAIIDKYRKLAHLPSVNHPIGMHSLRHTLASRLLKNEVPLDVISDILGHQSVDTTDIYLKVDIDSLRMCALQPPEVKIYE